MHHVCYTLVSKNQQQNIIKTKKIKRLKQTMKTKTKQKDVIYFVINKLFKYVFVLTLKIYMRG